MKRILESFSEENLNFDDPHVELRCRENNITKDDIVRILLYESNKLTNVIMDRTGVYKLYFKLSNKRQLKVIIDLFKHKEATIRTVKILDRKLYKKVRLIRRIRRR